MRGEVNDDLEEEARREPMPTRVEEVSKGWGRGGVRVNSIQESKIAMIVASKHKRF